MQNNDINFKGILIFLGVLTVTLVVVYATVAGMSRRFENRAARGDEAVLSKSPPRSVSANVPYFPGPREQPNPIVDLQALRAREDAEITNYGWINRTSGIVRIPIARAMELVLAKQQEAHP